jgi:hypothetical protein
MFKENQGEVRSIAYLKSLAQYICKPQSDDEIFNLVYVKRHNTIDKLYHNHVGNSARSDNR